MPPQGIPWVKVAKPPGKRVRIALFRSQENTFYLKRYDLFPRNRLRIYCKFDIAM